MNDAEGHHHIDTTQWEEISALAYSLFLVIFGIGIGGALVIIYLTRG